MDGGSLSSGGGSLCVLVAEKIDGTIRNFKAESWGWLGPSPQSWM